jgi:hypothetical protein
MPFLGMDPASVTSARDTLRRSHEGVRAAGRDVRGALDALVWHGDDAEAFRRTEAAELGERLLQLEGLLTALDWWITAQVADQHRTSGEL